MLLSRLLYTFLWEGQAGGGSGSRRGRLTSDSKPRSAGTGSRRRVLRVLRAVTNARPGAAGAPLAASRERKGSPVVGRVPPLEDLFALERPLYVLEGRARGFKPV